MPQNSFFLNFRKKRDLRNDVFNTTTDVSRPLATKPRGFNDVITGSGHSQPGQYFDAKDLADASNVVNSSVPSGGNDYFHTLELSRHHQHAHLHHSSSGTFISMPSTTTTYYRGNFPVDHSDEYDHHQQAHYVEHIYESPKMDRRFTFDADAGGGSVGVGTTSPAAGNGEERTMEYFDLGP